MAWDIIAHTIAFKLKEMARWINRQSEDKLYEAVSRVNDEQVGPLANVVNMMEDHFELVKDEVAASGGEVE